MTRFRAPILALAIGTLGLPQQAVTQNAKKSGAAYISAQKPRCAFHYDEKLETRALSILQHELSSSGARFYDASRPIVTVCRSKATLMFSGTKRDNEHYLLDPPHIYIDVDICSHRILAVDHDDGMTISDDPPCG